MDRSGAESLIEIPPGTPTDIVGAEEVWAAGGKVYVYPILPDPETGEKYSTTALVERIKEIGDGLCLI